jgi:hypothetical protein
VAAPTAADVAAFLGKTGDAATEAIAAQAITIITSLANSYTRGEGFTSGVPAGDISAAIFTAVLRFMANKSQIQYSKVKGPFTVEYRGGFDGWSVAEQFVLNRYRKRAE